MAATATTNYLTIIGLQLLGNVVHDTETVVGMDEPYSVQPSPLSIGAATSGVLREVGRHQVESLLLVTLDKRHTQSNTHT